MTYNIYICCEGLFVLDMVEIYKFIKIVIVSRMAYKYCLDLIFPYECLPDSNIIIIL